jgi:hypothetical protein
VRLYLLASTQHAPWPLEAPDDGRGANPPNTIDYKPFVRAAVDNLTAWVRDDVPPPPSAYPRLADGTLTAALEPAVDADGNETGGLRHPDVAVPLATFTGWNPVPGQSRTLVRGLGSTIPFSPDAILQRYADQEALLRRIRQSAEALVARRCLLAEDVERIVSTSAIRWDLCTRGASLPRTGATV